MKKYLYSALALPLLFACSSENFDEKVITNDQFAGIEKVDATFTMEGITRFDGGNDGISTWSPQNGDLWGFAWMGDGTNVAINGNAYQNHNLIQKGTYFEPQTSIYVGSYFIYRPYDYSTVSPQAINFKSLEEQPFAEGYESAKQPWRDLAKTAINIGTKWTVVDGTGYQETPGGTRWNKAGIKQNYKLYAAMFSNQTGLDLTYTQNDPAFTKDKEINGATDIKLTLKKGDKVGAAVIYDGTIDLQVAGASVAAKSFTYAPTASLEATDPAVDHDGGYWANKSNLAGGFTFEKGAIALNAGEGGYSTEDKKGGWFWFNSLPVVAGNGNEATEVIPVFKTSYGTVTVKKAYAPDANYTVKDCAYALNVEGGTAVFHPLADAADATKTPTVWAIGANNTFINQYGNHKGKFALNVDFSKGVMNDMHIKSDDHLQTALKYYIASGKTESPVVLNLDKEADGNFSISKISIALIQTIQADGKNVKVKACTTVGEEPAKIIITQKGQTGDLAAKKEVPALDKVFATATDVYLSKDYTWTWAGGDGDDALTIDGNVTSITNEGTLTVDATNIQLSVATTPAAPADPTTYTLKNAAGATMNITQVTTVKSALTNLGTINIGAADNTAAELRAYNAVVTNDATALKASGTINNYGVVGKSAGTNGIVNNYGLINMKDAGAITLLRTNEKGATPFSSAFVADANMMGTVVLPEGNPYALVSVSNGDETGFIKYKWTAETYAHDDGNVKYNTLVVERPNNGKIVFAGACDEIKYLEFNGVRTQVINPTAASKLTKLKGVIVNAEKSIIIEKTNELVCSDGAFLGDKATVYLGGVFTYVGTNNYFGTWSLDQIVEW